MIHWRVSRLYEPEGQAFKVAYLLVRFAVEGPSDDGLSGAALSPPLPGSHIEHHPIFLVRKLVTLSRLDGHTTVVQYAQSIYGLLVT